MKMIARAFVVLVFSSSAKASNDARLRGKNTLVQALVSDTKLMATPVRKVADAPDLVRPYGTLWDAVKQHAEGAFLAVNAKREDSDLSDLGDLSIKHAYRLRLGLREGFRICLTVTENGETQYVQIDTESSEGKEISSFNAIFNIVPVAIVGEEEAAAFEGKNDNDELDSYPCDAESEEALLQLSLAKKKSHRATGHIKELLPFMLVDTFLKDTRLMNMPDDYDFYTEYPECEVPVHDQGTCGSCYAFSTLAMLDGRTCKLAVDNGDSYDLSSLKTTSSEQDLLSCATPPNNGYCNGQAPYIDPNGCNGGTEARSILFIRENGLVNEQCMPYTAGGTGAGADHFAVNDGVVSGCAAKTCAVDSASRNISRPQSCFSGDVSCIKAAILSGPVSAGVRVNDDFGYYEGDTILHGTPVEKDGYHAVTLLGWRVEHGIEYWLGQNSWGTNWGHKGHFAIQFGEMEINDRVVWSNPHSGPQTNTDEHYDGVCMKIEENTHTSTCTFTNECEVEVRVTYMWSVVSSACEKRDWADLELWGPGDTWTAQDAYGCAILREEGDIPRPAPTEWKPRAGGPYTWKVAATA